jgi:integrase
MSVRKREWTTDKGERKAAWVVDYRSHGQRKLKTFDKKRDADHYNAKVKTEIAAGIHSAGKTTVAEAGELWLRSREDAGRERATIVTYTEHLKLHIDPFIGNVRLADLTLPRVRRFEDQLREGGRSPKMVRRILVSLSSILSDAQDRGLVAQNVLHRRRAKNGHHDERGKRRLEVGVDIPRPDEIRALIAHLNGDRRERPLILTAIFTGLRASELRGLTWADVDLDCAELHVRQRADRFAEIGPTKSAAGRRTVPLLPMCVNALREWKLASGTADGLVFPGRHGRPLAHRILITHWHAAQIRADIVGADGKPRYPGLHALRHWFASWCLNRKQDGGLELPLKLVQGRLGHSTIAMTADRYGHLFAPGDAEAEMLAAERAFLAI